MFSWEWDGSRLRSIRSGAGEGQTQERNRPLISLKGET